MVEIKIIINEEKTKDYGNLKAVCVNSEFKMKVKNPSVSELKSARMFKERLGFKDNDTPTEVINSTKSKSYKDISEEILKSILNSL